MKKWLFLPVIILLILLSCAREQEIKLREIRKNHNNFPSLKAFHSNGYQWKMSDWFTKQDTAGMNYPDLAMDCKSQQFVGYEIPSLSLYLTFDFYNESELKDLLFLSTKRTVHTAMLEHYSINVNEDEPIINNPISKPWRVKNDYGYHVVLVEMLKNSTDVGNQTDYLLATLVRKNRVVVMQFFGNGRANGILTDDIERMLATFH